LTAPLLTNLPYNVFYGCKDLEKVDVGSVGQIIAGAFNQCSSLKTLLLRSGAVATLENTTAFSGVNSALAIYVPDVLVDSYKSSSNWTSYASKIKPLSEYQG
jgi:hypothetical protein